MSKASTLCVAELQDKPKSLMRDFYIYQLLSQGVSDKEAQTLLPLVKRLNAKLIKRFTPHIDAFKRKAYCKTLKDEALLGVAHDCVAIALPLSKASQMQAPLLENIASHIALFNPNLNKEYTAIATHSWEALLTLPPALLIETFNKVTKNFRQTYYSHPLPKATLTKLTQEKQFPRMLEKIIRGHNTPLQKSLLDTNASQMKDATSHFLLALNALRFDQKDLALSHLKIAQENAPYRLEKDKALFWRYLISKDATLLETLIKSFDINIYSLYAFETLGKFPQNITYEIPTHAKTNAFDVSAPFGWVSFQEKIKQKKFKDKKAKEKWLLTQGDQAFTPHLSMLLYNYHDNKNYFLTPYERYLESCAKKRKILIYALARQESRFVPTAISSSYALGVMQFMPFLAKDIAQKEGIEPFDYAQMFAPKTALHFANIHLDFLEKSFSHPLFIAYAYNAGIGFTKRNITQKEYFKSEKYEPFWSLEMVPNAQARKYGKHILANYAIYAKRFGDPMTLRALFESLK